MPTGNDLPSIWAEIESHPTHADGEWRFQQIDPLEDGRRLTLAIDDQGQHHLLVPKAPGSVPTNTRSPLAVSVRDFSFGHDSLEHVSGHYLDIHCRIDALNAQFDKVISDVVDVVQGSSTPAVSAVATVGAWRRLFAILADGHTLSYPEKIAVFGELTVLQELMEHDGGFEVASWTGPDHAAHDFELSEQSIEVKSIGEDSTTVTIHGLDQLDSVNDKPLYLVVRTIIESASGRTISEVLGEILCASVDPNGIRHAAAKLGVSDTDADPTRFEVQTTMIAEVIGDFPRIIKATVAPHVSESIRRISYELDLRSLSPFLRPTRIDRLESDT